VADELFESPDEFPSRSTFACGTQKLDHGMIAVLRETALERARCDDDHYA
jgi:hypothetical protein